MTGSITQETELDSVQKEVLGLKKFAEALKPEFKAAVGLSRKWDAREAGREVADDTLRKLNEKKPDFFLLFSTIHYEKYGGFKELLNGVWDVLPEGTPLIGGTVAGFMNPDGCFTRGVTALAVSYSNIKAVTGIGYNTKRWPKAAGKEFANLIKRNLGHCEYKNKFSFCMLPGGTIPQFPFFGRKKVIKGELLGKFSLDLLDLSTRLFQLGPGREEEVMDSLSRNLPDWNILGGSTMDDLSQRICYQFMNKKVHKNSVVGLGISSDLNTRIITKYGLKPTGLKLNITKKGLRGCAIMEIDGKPAVSEFLKRIGWPEELLDERVYSRVFYYPLGYIYKGVLRPQIIGAFVGEDIACGYSIKGNEIEILSASGESLISAMIEGIDEAIKHNPKMLLGIACATQLETLGEHIFKVHSVMNEKCPDIPFLILYCAGEESYTPESPVKQLYDSFNLGFFN